MANRSNFDWNLEGRKVRIAYQGGQLIGTVRESRCKYGGYIQHSIDLDFPIIDIYDDTIKYVLIEEKNCEEYNDELLEIYRWST